MNKRKSISQKQANQARIDRRYVLIALSISLFAFVGGIFIGKKLTPPDSVQDLEKQIKQTKLQDQFTFFYTLPNRKPEEGTSPPKPHLRPSTDMDHQKDAVPPSKNQADQGSDTLRNKKAILQHSAAPGEERYTYTFQVAAFRTKNKAEKLIRTLKNEGYSAYLIRVDLGSKGVWYRVRVGQFLSRPEAEKQLYTLSKKTGLKGFVAKSTR